MAAHPNDLIRALVAGAPPLRRAADEAWLSNKYGLRGLPQDQLEHAQDWVTDALTQRLHPHLERRARRRRAAAQVAVGAPDRVQTWTVPGPGHTEGLQTHSEQWETRVIALLTDSLEANREPS